MPIKRQFPKGRCPLEGVYTGTDAPNQGVGPPWAAGNSAIASLGMTLLRLAPRRSPGGSRGTWHALRTSYEEEDIRSRTRFGFPTGGTLDPAGKGADHHLLRREIALVADRRPVAFGSKGDVPVEGAG